MALSCCLLAGTRAAASPSFPSSAAIRRRGHRPLTVSVVPLSPSQQWRHGLRFCCASSTSSSPPPPAPPEEPDDYELLDTTGNCDPLCSVDEVSSQYFEANYKPKNDLLNALTIIGAALAGAAAINHSWVAANQDIAMVLVFAIGYAGIIFEESLAFNKSGVALLMAVCLWVIRSIGAPSTDVAVQELSQTTSEVSEIVFFLLGAMTIVEIVDAHQGFKLVTDNISTRNPKTLLWVIGIVTFFMSSILDNLTSTIVMVSLLRKLVPPSEYRKLLGAVVVIAANAGGAWTPIGDVTTTMLWIHGQITTLKIMQGLFIPSAVSLAVPLALMSLTSEANGSSQKSSNLLSSEQMAPRGQLVLGVGVGALVFVPIFKALTGLPPFMGMLLGLGILWILTDAIHYGDSERQRLKVPQALSRIDTQGILFFLGILLSIGSLESAGILRQLANYLDANIPNADLIASAIGVASAIIDNVPLVAATMGMYDLTSFPQDSDFWQLVAFCAGTGGSMLIIGSAAGVAFMGMEKVDFFWYFRKDDELAIVVANEPVALAIHCGDTDDDDGEVIPIEIVRPRRVGPKKRKLPGVPQTQGYDANGHHISVSSSVDENRESAMARAEEIQSSLPAEHPSFVKHMLRSHVVKGFWLGLPKHFCDKHLPNRDVAIVLEDENGEDHHTTYLGYKQGLSAGWRGFAIDHDIKVGDVVVFELVKSTKFKVYIVRANGFTTADVDPNLQNLEARKKVGEEQSCEDVITEEDTEDTTTNNREMPPSDGIGISDSEIDFDDVTSFSNVNVILDCLATDCEFHDRLRRTYYELCCSRKSLLHKHLLKQLHPTLVAGVIIETVSIADGIRACKAEASSREDFLVWKKTLESFELLGMNVAFLLNRVNSLLGVASRSRESYAEWQHKYEELKLERARAGDKMKALELQLSNVKDVLQKVDSEMEELQSSFKKSDETLQELASAPW